MANSECPIRPSVASACPEGISTSDATPAMAASSSSGKSAKKRIAATRDRSISIYSRYGSGPTSQPRSDLRLEELAAVDGWDAVIADSRSLDETLEARAALRLLAELPSVAARMDQKRCARVTRLIRDQLGVEFACLKSRPPAPTAPFRTAHDGHAPSSRILRPSSLHRPMVFLDALRS